MVKGKKVLVVDVVLVVFTLVVLAGTAVYWQQSKSVSFSPEDVRLINEEKAILFFIPSEMIEIDASSDFTKPDVIELHDGFVLELRKGEHYLRFERGEYYEVVPLNAAYDIALLFRENSHGGYSVFNANEDDVLVEVTDPSGELSLVRFSGGAK